MGEVLFELMSGALAGFRGHTLGELTAYVRCICDRMLWRAAQKQIRERDTLSETGGMADVVREWNGRVLVWFGTSRHVFRQYWVSKVQSLKGQSLGHYRRRYARTGNCPDGGNGDPAPPFLKKPN